MNIPFVNAYAQLPAICYERLHPTPVKAPQLIRFNHALATELGIELGDTRDQALADYFAGNAMPEGADPLAMAYCGHQFGHLNPQLGDGRALLLGDVRDQQGNLRDIQLKGSGRTPFSRNGDGRSPLGPALREYILCESMHALGVPTTRALAVVATGEPVYRQRAEPGAVFTRVAASHLRVGTLQLFALRQEHDALRALADHTIARHFPEIDPNAPDRHLHLLQAVCQRQADLIAQWMLLGFIHGVMNTDNMTLSGETIDYGPCAFMDTFKAGQVFSAIDEQGRYAYHNQPAIGQWNLARLAESLIPILPMSEDDAIAQATDLLKGYSQRHHDTWEQGMARKLGFSRFEDGDLERAAQLLELMEAARLDYTQTFRRLSDLTHSDQDRQPLLGSLCGDTAQSLNNWLDEWQAALAAREGDTHAIRTRMQAVNPAIIPRNHRVAEAIAAAEAGDYSVFEALLAATAAPYDDDPQFAAYQQPPTAGETVSRTFCGT